MSLNHITLSGGLLTHQFVEAIQQPSFNHPAAAPETFALPGQKTPSPAELERAIGTAWELLVERWDGIERDLPGMDISTLRDRWIRPFFSLLDFNLEYQRADLVIEDGGPDHTLRFPISHLGLPAGAEGVRVPVHSVLTSQGGDAAGLDARRESGTGLRRLSPHDLLQRYLNLSRASRWGLLSDGLRLRLLRDYHHTYTRGYVEFDLQGIFSARDFAAFRALYRLCHASRFLLMPAAPAKPAAAAKKRKAAVEEDEIETEGAEETSPEIPTPLESFYQHALSTGVKVGEDLRERVRLAIHILGNGFLQATPGLLPRLQNGEISVAAFYDDILHTIYRVLFLLFAEQRGMFPGRGSLYMEVYSLTALRLLAERPLGEDPHTDLWEQLKATFRMVEHGAPELGIYGYNGALFSSTKTPILTPLDMGDEGAVLILRNDSLLKAIRFLTTVERDKVLQRISYADLSVEEIGSVYESLLDYTPRIAAAPEKVDDQEIAAGEFFLDPRGKERKTTGSYYTHPSLVNELIKSALLPVLEDRLKAALAGYDSEHPEKLSPEDRQKAEEALLAIKVIDPAAGSGAFLIAADNALGLRLAQIRSGDLYPSEREIRRARRDVLAHCLYAVDLNPMAVELCKLSLWINAVVEDEKLNFLDHHIKCGNSLVGAFRRLVTQGIPSEAYGGATGDDKELARALKKRNDQERAGQLSALRVTEFHDPAELHAWFELSRLAQEDPAEAERRYRELQAQSEESAERLAFDLWTAAFFWPLEAESDGRTARERASAGIEARRGERRQPLPPTTQDVFQALATPRLVDERMKDFTRKLRDQHRFFHWELEFPEIFGPGGQGGFDVVLGNPPWERQQFEEKAFFEYRRPEIANEPSQKTRWSMVLELQKTDPNLFSEWMNAKRHDENLYKFLRNSSRFPLSAIDKFNLYAIFAELAGELYNQSGRAGIIVKAGYLTDKLCARLFSETMQAGKIIAAYEFENKKKLFSSVHPQERYVLLTLGTRNFLADFVFDIYWVQDIEDDTRHIQMTLDDITLLSPNTKNCPKFSNYKEFRITRICNNNGIPLIRYSPPENPWNITIDRYINISDFSDKILTHPTIGFIPTHRFSPNEVLVPIYEGKLIHQYDHRFATYEVNGNLVEFSNKSPIETVQCFRFIAPQHALRRNPLLESVKGVIAIRDITNRTNERGAIATIIPANITDYTIRAITLPNRAIDSLLLLSNINSFVFDFLARQRIGGTHLSNYILEQTPVIHPARFNQSIQRVVLPKVIELTYTAWDLENFLHDVWRKSNGDLRAAILYQWDENAAATNGGHAGAQRPEWAGPPDPDGFPRPPFKWDEERRAHLRAELDGLYAHLYGLTRDEFAYILDTFPIVRRKDEARYGEYRTKRLCLEAYDRLAGSDLIPPEARALQAESVIGDRVVVPVVKPAAAGAQPTSREAAQEPATKAQQAALSSPAGERVKGDAPPKPESKPAEAKRAADKTAADKSAREKSAGESRPQPAAPASPAAEQLPLTDYSLYRCAGCGKRVLGFDREEHTRKTHGNKDPGYQKIGG